MGILLWILALILLVFGVGNLIQGDILWGIVLIVIACALGGWGGFSGPR